MSRITVHHQLVRRASSLVQSSGSTISFTTSPSLSFASPERGLYVFLGSFTAQTQANVNTIGNNPGFSMGYCWVDLSAYRTQSIPQSFLDSMTTVAGYFRTAGFKCVWRPMYDSSSGSGNDATLAQIQTHTSQLGTWLATNRDIVGACQAGYIGAYGEWWGSTQLGASPDGTQKPPTAANRDGVALAIMQNYPADLMVDFRYVGGGASSGGDIYRWWPTALSSNSFASRSGVAAITEAQCQRWAGCHNDSFDSLGTNEGGTWDSGTQQTERQYWAASAKWTRYGGEPNAGTPTFQNCSYGGDPSIQPQGIELDGPYHYVSYLNGYGGSVYTNWTSQGCWNSGGGTYPQGALDYIGYRIQLDSASAPSALAIGGAAGTVTIKYRNVGWARMYSARKLVVTLLRQGGGGTVTATASNFIRELDPQAVASTSHDISVSVPGGTAAGTYDVYLSVPDTFSGTSGLVSFNARFANADVAGLNQSWDATNARFKTGLTINLS